MIDYKYTYLIFNAIFFLIWLIIFLWRKDIRKEMLIISLIFGFAGIASEFIYTQDWWMPLTITNTLVGIEDFLIGFFIGGVGAVIYEEISKKRLKNKKSTQRRLERIKYRILITLGSSAILFFGSFYLLKINSFYASLVAFIIPTLFIWFKRNDLIINSLLSGLVLLIIGTLIYMTLHLIQPGFIGEFWFLEKSWYTILFLGVPLAEYIWYFFAGAYIAPLYEYWQEARLINKR